MCAQKCNFCINAKHTKVLHDQIKTIKKNYSISLLTKSFFPVFGWTLGWSCFFWDLQEKEKQLHLPCKGRYDKPSIMTRKKNRIINNISVYLFTAGDRQNGYKSHTVSFCISAVLLLASHPSIPNCCLLSLTSRSVPYPESRKTK